ncbi:MAG: TIGR01777 family protein [Dyadobacter sp. 50-39]|uniref:TIGR01777 family oxidoreductase n=1 Tax=Dyadobacter sp. 50-39 TaxID=1895756 RepID=UPI000964BB8D|nr:TIGR01777 family oxidoreductase [Dyadobacter sp. 50-39]OJV21286.1 MAG: TIGR01777 family protein [Dyadobacter sp. 50-39]
MGKKVLITGGTGLIGKRLTQLLLDKGYEVALLSRKKADIPSVQVFEWDIQKNYIEEGALDNLHFLVHLAGTNVAEGRWTEERKKSILESRTESIRLIARKLAEKQIKPAAFVSASGISYYGQDTGDLRNTESTPAGNDFLAHVSIEWEKAADEIAALNVRTVKLRTGIVISKHGGAIPKMALPARFGVGAPLGSGKQWISWIHLDDMCRMYIEALENESWQGAYNAVASPPVTNEGLTNAICKVLHRPQWFPNVPAFALKMVFGEMSAVVLGGNYVINERMERETGFQYRYGELEAALKAELG